MEAERQADEAAKARRIRTVDGLTAAFDADVSAILRSVGSAAAELGSTSNAMTLMAAGSAKTAMTVAAASEQASGNVQTVASASEELSASIEEIGRQVLRSQEVARRAADEAARTDVTVQDLIGGSQKIGEVVQLISSIAAQTNL